MRCLWRPGGDHRCRDTGPRPLLAALAAIAFALSLQGCSSREAIHPALRVEAEDYDRAVQRGRDLLARGETPYHAYGYSTQTVNVRLARDVIIREVTCCWPGNEIAFAVASQQNPTEAQIEMAAREARKRVEREIKFIVLVQMPEQADPGRLEFTMRSSLDHSYPAIAVEAPVRLRDISSALDPDMPPSRLYRLNVRFPVQGSPGYPAVGPEVTRLELVVGDGEATVTLPSFPMPRRSRR